MVAQARRFGLSRLAVPTQGNAGDSLTPILGNVTAALRYPDRVGLELVGPTLREAGALDYPGLQWRYRGCSTVGWSASASGWW